MRRIGTLVAMLLVLACSEWLGPAPEGKQLAIIEGGPEGNLPGLPDTVSAGRVTIAYCSFGSSSCNIPAGEDVVATGSEVVITAYDKYVPPESVCTADFGRFARIATVVLTPGAFAVRLRGVRLSGGREVIEVEKTLVVK